MRPDTEGGVVRYHRFRRRVRETFTQDWLEIVVAVFGVICLAVGALSLYVTIFLVVHWNDSTVGFPAGTSFVKGDSGFGVALFAVITVIAFAGGWALVGKRAVRKVIAASRRRRARDSGA